MVHACGKLHHFVAPTLDLHQLLVHEKGGVTGDNFLPGLKKSSDQQPDDLV